MGSFCGTGSDRKKYQEDESVTVEFLLPEQPLHNSCVFAAEYCGDGTVLSADQRGGLRRFSLERRKELNSWRPHDRAVTSLSVDLQNGLVLTTSRDKTAAISSFNSLEPVVVQRAHSQAVLAGDFSFERGTCWTGSRDYSVKKWDVGTGEVIRSWDVSRNVVRGMRVAGPSLMAQCSEDLTLKLWDDRMEEPAHVMDSGPNLPQGVDVYNCKAVTCHNGFNGTGCELRTWDFRMFKQLVEFNGHAESVPCVRFMTKENVGGPPSQRMVSGSKDRTIRLWDVESGKCLETLKREDFGTVYCVSSWERQVCAGHLEGYMATYDCEDDALRPGLVY